MENNILINFAEEDEEALRPVLRRLMEKFPGAGYGPEAVRSLKKYRYIVNLYTPAAEKSADYRRVIGYAVKHHLDCLLFHVEPEAASFDMELTVQVLLGLLNGKTPAAEGVPQGAAAGTDARKAEGEAPEKAAPQGGQDADRSAQRTEEGGRSEEAAKAGDVRSEETAKAESVRSEETAKAEIACSAETANAETARSEETAKAGDVRSEETAKAETAQSAEGTVPAQPKTAEPAAQHNTAVLASAQSSTAPQADEAAEQVEMELQQVVTREEEEIEKAADQRSLVRDRLYAEGVLYMNGIERKQNPYKAFDCFRQAANAGSVLAQYQLSVCYDQGIGVRRSAAEAARWCEMAAFGGYGKAQCVIGYCYETGQGVSRNMRDAVRWYQAAAEQGEIEAINNLAFCYQKGRGVRRDMDKAIALYEQAAEAGHASAQYNLGFCYWYGEGVKSDKQRAIELFRTSAKSGNQKAQQMMKILNLHAYVK